MSRYYRRRYLKLAHGCTAADPDGIVSYTAHELRHVCASLLIASGVSDVQVAHQMGDSKIETTKNICGHLIAQDRTAILDAMNQAVSRLHFTSPTIVAGCLMNGGRFDCRAWTIATAERQLSPVDCWTGGA